ncbi:DCD domain-containing protein NRP-B-like [Typha angustifolia]|uniref:DCD domain-containing protein NRP-B-like n=1 Tax=Typha angustifolia TaxID=59011 RepID=UPI003C2CFC74
MEGIYNKEQSSFWQFSDQLRLQTTNFSNLSIGDSIWSDSSVKKNEERRNYENPISAPISDLGAGFGLKTGFGPQKLAFGTSNNADRYNTNSKNIGVGGGIKNGNYFNNNNNNNNFNNNNINTIDGNGEIKNYFNKAINKPAYGNSKKYSNGNNNDGSGKKKNTSSSNKNNSNDNNNAAVDKRFKTLPPSEALPRNEMVGGYIFVCNNDTMEENLKRQLFGLPPRYRDSVRAITPGLPLFLYNYSTHQLHGIFEAASFGGTNIDPTAWEDKKCPGESRFPSQVRVVTRKICDPLEEDAFRPILHHYDGPKFRLELNVPEALALLDIFAENNA